MIQRNSVPAIAAHHYRAAEKPPRPASAGRMSEQAAEGHMTNAQQAFLFTGELFVLSFVAIYAVWLVDKVLRNFRR